LLNIILQNSSVRIEISGSASLRFSGVRFSA
jgi:hypothetical protein